MYQIAINVLIYASYNIILGLAFFCVFSVCKRFDISIAAFISLGAYFTLTLLKNIDSLTAIFMAILILSTFGFIQEYIFFSPLNYTKNRSRTSLLISIGIMIIIQNLISLIWGDDRRRLILFEEIKSIRFGDASLSSVQLVIIIVAIFSLCISWLIFNKTRLGMQLRAVISNERLAYETGQNLTAIKGIAVGLGAAFSAIGGILMGADNGLTPTMGFTPLLLGLTAVIVGGSRVWGIALGALLISTAQNVGIVFISSQWRDAIAFAILLIFLVFRPYGFLGVASKKSSV